MLALRQVLPGWRRLPCLGETGAATRLCRPLVFRRNSDRVRVWIDTPSEVVAQFHGHCFCCHVTMIEA
jgi:hypothetical protein